MTAWLRVAFAAAAFACSLPVAAQVIVPVAPGPEVDAATMPDDSAVADADLLLQACIGPYAEAHPDAVEALDQRIAAAGLASALLQRLAQGAPAQWREGLLDARVPEPDRVQAALGAVGMAISHGPGWQRPIARAYSARFVGATIDGCAVPPSLVEFVARTDFWAQSTASAALPPTLPTRP